MGKLKGYCQWCGYFEGEDQSTFVRADEIDYDGKILGRCTKCGGLEFFSASKARKSVARRAGGKAAKGAWHLTKGVAKAGGAVVKGSYEVAKWGYDKVSEERPEAADSTEDLPTDEVPPSLPDGILDEAGGPPEVPDDIFDESVGPPEIPDVVFDQEGGAEGMAAAMSGYERDKAPFLTGDAAEILAEEPTGSILEPTNELTAEDVNAIDDAPLDDDYNAEPMPHEGPVHDYAATSDTGTGAGESGALPSQEQIIAEDTEWRRANAGQATPAEMARHDEQYRQQLYRRRAMDIEQGGGRIQHGPDSYEELLPDGTIHAVEKRQHGAESSSLYERWDRPDGTSKSQWQADESSTDPSGASTSHIHDEGTEEFDGEAYHIHNETHSETSEIQTRDGGGEGRRSEMDND